MTKLLAFLGLFLLLSCQITETINLNQDGSGTIETTAIRDEHSYMQLAGEQYSKEEIFRDTTYVFQDYITKYAENFAKLPASEKAIFNQYKGVKVHLKESSFEKEVKNTFTYNFSKVEAIPDLHKTTEYADDLKHNYALSAEEHYYHVSFTFDGTTFKRVVKITNPEELKKKQEQVEKFKTKNSGFKLVQTYTLEYHFPREIKSVSNEKAIVSPDKKSLKLVLQLSDCLQNPELSNLEIVIEK
ncbi:hypothetical protein [Flavobacterium poyangense]|uniref:hypothetical protein n=1 Tax=Flavobacterium poyangense TaxID=2204302 RepID=UPI00141D8B96|nr:hypothetical protein [Flavobacterium sp. JXAS1]